MKNLFLIQLILIVTLSEAFCQSAMDASYLTLHPQNSTSEGGELQLLGAGAYNDWRIDNRLGSYRLHHSGITYFDLTHTGFLKLNSYDYTFLKAKRLTSGGGLVMAFENGSGDGKWSLGVGSDHNFGIYKSDDSFASQFVITQSGRVGIGTVEPHEVLHVHGTATIAGNIGTVSDAIWKTGQHTFELQNSDAGDVVLAFHRAGHTSASLRHTSNGGLIFTGNGGYNASHLHISTGGNVGIGILNAESKLEVDGKVRAEEIKVEVVNPPDYVFEPDYDLPTLEETKAYIAENKHLPEVPSAKEMEANGIELGEMNMLLLKKIEELTLHVIELQQQVNEMKAKGTFQPQEDRVGKSTN